MPYNKRMEAECATKLDSGHLGLLTGYFFTINTIVGAGFLSLPWAFSQGGWAFSALYLCMTVLSNIVLSLQLLNIMSKVELLTQLTEEGHEVRPVNLRSLLNTRGDYEVLIASKHEPQIRSRRLDVSECMRMVFGRTSGFLYIILMLVYVQGAELAYASIFAMSFAANIPIGDYPACDITESRSFLSECRVNY